MARNALIIVGAVLVVMGLLFGLQGIGVIGGSPMSGTTFWSVAGPLIAVVGLVLIAVAYRRPRRR